LAAGEYVVYWVENEDALILRGCMAAANWTDFSVTSKTRRILPKGHGAPYDHAPSSVWSAG